jgi:hypothetical protein
MSILTAKEKTFLDVFLHEATTSPFRGPATEALHRLGVEYGDILYLAWAYEQDVPRTSYEWGHAAEAAPPVPWTSRDSALRRNMEIRQFCERQRERLTTPPILPQRSGEYQTRNRARPAALSESLAPRR